MEDQNCTVVQSLNSPQNHPPMSPARTADINTVPVVMGAVGVDNSFGGGKPEPFGSEGVLKRRRGRPRKNGVGGNLLSPASAPSGFSTPPLQSSAKRGRGRPRGSGKLQLLASMGGIVSDTAGGSFTPHVVTVNTGEDVVARILSFSHRGPRALCILSATGAVSNVTICQPKSSSGTLRYQGCFEILSLSGSYTLGDVVGRAHQKSLIMSISLAKPDGRVFGGAVEGPLIAAAPIQLIVGSFKQNISNEIKRRLSPASAIAANMPDGPGSMRPPLQVPKMIEAEPGFPSPTSGLMPTSNGLQDNVMPGRSSGLPNIITSATANGLPDNFFPENHQNMHSASLNGVGLDCQVLQPMTDQMTFGDLNNSVPQI